MCMEANSIYHVSTLITLAVNLSLLCHHHHHPYCGWCVHVPHTCGGQRQLPFLLRHLPSLLPYSFNELAVHRFGSMGWTVNPRDPPVPTSPVLRTKALMPHRSFTWVLGIKTYGFILWNKHFGNSVISPDHWKKFYNKHSCPWYVFDI